jgi:threonine/homoserine/homoserine lactone efflux protein
MAYLPQFADPSAGSMPPQTLTLGLTFALLTWAMFSVVALFSGALGRWPRSRPGFASGLGWLTGGVLIGLGLRLAFSDRR